MLHGPWIADALRNYFTGAGTGGGGGGGATSVEIAPADAILMYDSAVVENDYIRPAATGGIADYTCNLALDPATAYTIEVDYIEAQGTVACYFEIYSSLGPTQADADAATWYTIGAKQTGFTGSGTITFNVGPGIDQWDQAVTDGEAYLIFEHRYMKVTGIRIASVTGGAGGGTGAIYPNGALDLSTFINYYDMTAWNGSYLAAATPGGFGQFSFPYALDPADTISFEVDYTVGSGTDAGLYLHSSLGPSGDEFSSSTQRTLRANEGISGSGTLAFDVGPGIASFDAAMTAGEHYITFELARDMQITAIRVSGVDTGPADPGGEEPGTAPVIKAMAMDVTHIPTAGTASRSGLTGEITGGGYTAGGVEVSGLTVTWDDPNSRVVVTCDLIDFGAVTATDVSAVVFYADNGSPSADRVLWTDTFPPVSAAGSLTYEPHPDGVMEIRV